MDKRKYKMTSEELALWIALRKKCTVHKSKKDYNRKQKHKKDLSSEGSFFI